ncbi:DsbA family protein [Acidicapsa dinghuensis]|uniref:DsbA family protein n=1 Tax=Acidicapsa dinghuensis TaxID=2218256 RepID=A0ABW1EDF1_9BACT|nr:DsbA family protein [Acidicapsa dinghuensis]
MPKLTVPVSKEDHAEGMTDARCTLVEYGDYQCLNCGAAYPLVKRLQRHFGSQLRFVFRNFPMTRLHAEAENAAQVAEFAGAHGKFWEVHDLLLENQLRLGDALYAEIGEQCGLQLADLRDALQQQVFLKRVRDDFAGGVRSGVNGTPTFFVNDERFNGPKDFEHLSQAIEDAIRQ